MPLLSRALMIFALVLASSSVPSAARADESVKLKRGKFRLEKDKLTLSVGFRELFSAAMRRRLKNGFATTVVMRIHLFEADGKRTVSFTARTLKAVYDLWDEAYTIRMNEPPRTRHVKKKAQKDVVDRLTSLWHFPVADLAKVKPGRRYFVAVIVEVNPISEDLLSEVRRWLRNPKGSRQRMGGENLFGSFVSIFVNNKIRRAERTYRLRTQEFFHRQ